ncbi:MAG: dihydropteroate synthase [Actinomycetota bacterium]
MGVDTPLVCVRDASHLAVDGQVRLVLSRLGDDHLDAVADALTAAGAHHRRVDGRIEVVARPEVVAASLATDGRTDVAAARALVDAAVDARTRGAPDLLTPAGTLPTASRPVVMGVLNVTPDSFSDGGHHLDGDRHPYEAVAAGRAMLAAGADLVDVGGESTRPGAEPVDADEERRRVLPVVAELAAAGTIVSIDTVKAEVAREAVAAGAAVVNDVSTGSLDPAMFPTVAELGVPYVLTHLQGTPRTMQRAPAYQDVVAEVFEALAGGLERLEELGLPRERVMVDPGIGFGKTLEHNLELLRCVGELCSLGRPVLVGTSRKGFIGRLTGVDDPLDRLEGSLATASLAVAGGARIVRAHDVAATVRAVTVAHAVATAGEQ